MITALVLAAGRSRRMGTQKLLLPLDGKPVIAHVVDQLLRSPVDRVLVVIGEDEDCIRQALGRSFPNGAANSRIRSRHQYHTGNCRSRQAAVTLWKSATNLSHLRRRRP